MAAIKNSLPNVFVTLAANYLHTFTCGLAEESHSLTRGRCPAQEGKVKERCHNEVLIVFLPIHHFHLDASPLLCVGLLSPRSPDHQHAAATAAGGHGGHFFPIVTQERSPRSRHKGGEQVLLSRLSGEKREAKTARNLDLELTWALINEGVASEVMKARGRCSASEASKVLCKAFRVEARCEARIPLVSFPSVKH